MAMTSREGAPNMMKHIWGPRERGRPRVPKGMKTVLLLQRSRCLTEAAASLIISAGG